MKKIMELYARNRAVPGRGLTIAAADTGEATVYLYDIIVADATEAEWYGGVDPLSFARTLSEIKAPLIHLRINSPGGSVFAARAIEQALREHPARVVAHIDGYAASAASIVMLGADERVISPGGMVMIHKGWTVAIGNADDLKATADILDKVDETIVESYARVSGQTTKRIASWMAAETWFTAKEALDAGFVTSIAEDQPLRAMAWDMTAYAKGPEAQSVSGLSTITPDVKPQQQGQAADFISDELRERLAQRCDVMRRAQPAREQIG